MLKGIEEIFCKENCALFVCSTSSLLTVIRQPAKELGQIIAEKSIDAGDNDANTKTNNR
jgi:hypothetical protein